MHGASQRLKKKSKGTEVSKPKSAVRTCGNCVESGHSIRTCPQMKPVSAARLKEVLEHDKGTSGAYTR